MQVGLSLGWMNREFSTQISFLAQSQAPHSCYRSPPRSSMLALAVQP